MAKQSSSEEYEVARGEIQRSTEAYGVDQGASRPPGNIAVQQVLIATY